MLGKLGRINIKRCGSLGVAETLLPSSNSNQGFRWIQVKDASKTPSKFKGWKAEADSKRPPYTQRWEFKDTPSLFHLLIHSWNIYRAPVMILTATKRHDFFWEGTQSRWDQPGDRSAPGGTRVTEGESKGSRHSDPEQKSQKMWVIAASLEARHHGWLLFLSLYTLVLLQRGCVPLLFRRGLQNNSTRAPSHAAPPAWSLVAPAPLQACGLPSSSGFARQPPRPQRPLPGFSLPFKPHTVLLTTPRPQPPARAAGCGSPCSMAPAPILNPCTHSLLADCPWDLQQAFSPPSRDTCCLASRFSSATSLSPPALPNSLSCDQVCDSGVRCDISSQRKPCLVGRGSSLFTHKGGGKATFSLATDQCLVLPADPLIQGYVPSPKAQQGLVDTQSLQAMNTEAEYPPAANYRCWPNTGLENHYP